MISELPLESAATDIKEIYAIDPSKSGKVIGLIILGFMILWLIPIEFLIITEIFSGKLTISSIFLPFFMVVVIPIIFYLLGIIFAYLYNMISKRFGGIEIELK